MGSLQELQQELRHCARQPDGSPALPPAGQALALSQDMILAHRVGDPGQFVDTLLKQGNVTLKAKTGYSVRAGLGTDGCVFLWVGASAYFQPPFVIFLDPVLETAHQVLAAPWDTKGLINMGSIGRRLSVEEARDRVTRYSLPPPDYRGHLAEVLQHCFKIPLGYVRGDAPNGCYPGREGRVFQGVSQGQPDTAPQTFEARLRGDVPLQGNILSIVFDPASLFDIDVKRESLRLTSFKKWCRDSDIRLVEYLSLREKSLRDVIVDEALELLEQRGAV